MAGLTAATKIAHSGKSVLILSQGTGVLSLSSGCVDILGKNHLSQLVQENAQHPYAKVGLELIQESCTYFKKIMAAEKQQFVGEYDKNFLLSTDFGTVRPTGLVPQGMAAGDVRLSGNTLVMGIEQLLDFYPQLITTGVNKIRQKLSIAGRWHWGGSLQLDLENVAQFTPVTIANWLEKQENLEQFIRQIKEIIKANEQLAIERIGLPAVLGNHRHSQVLQQLADHIPYAIFEIPVGQPTVPGMRVINGLTNTIKKLGGKVQLSSKVNRAYWEAESFAVEVDSPGRPTVFRSEHLILATGGIYGQGLTRTTERTVEPICNLLVSPLQEDNKNLLASRKFFTDKAQPYAYQGIEVDQNLAPLTGDHQAKKIKVVGRSIAGYDPVIEKNGLGVALATGYQAGKIIAEGGELC